MNQDAFAKNAESATKTMGGESEAC